MKNFTRYSDANGIKFLIRVLKQFTVWIYIEILEPGAYQTWKVVQYIIGIRTETRQKINAVHCSRGIYLPFYFYKALFACVKDSACLMIAILVYCLTIFGSVFGVLFCLKLVKSSCFLIVAL